MAQKEYYVCLSNSADDFKTIKEPESFYTNFNKARSYAKEMSLKYKAVDLRCEKWISDGFWDGMVTIWAERYENGKKQWRTDLL